jgi:hypothetical protein
MSDNKLYELSDATTVEIDNIREKINEITFHHPKKTRRNIKKYELLNALINIGLRHKKEICKELGLTNDDVGNLEL